MTCLRAAVITVFVVAATSDAPSEVGLPRRFGPYILVDKIGQGGMAEIFLATATTALGGHRRLVVKQILPLLAESQTFSRLLIDEAKLSAQLVHGNIVQIFDLGREDDVLYIAMEYVEGVDLHQLLRLCAKKDLGLSLEFALLIISEVLEGLDYAHKKRDDRGKPLDIVHRDVSPSNVLLSLEGEVKLCDFGIARALGIASTVPPDTIQGKAGYMSPEGASGGEVDSRSDIFSVGVILWELLSGRRLYRGEQGSPPALSLAQEAHIPEIPLVGFDGEAVLHRIVRRALAKNPKDRYQSAREMHADVDAYMEQFGVFPNPVRFGRWLSEHGAKEVVERRHALERAALDDPTQVALVDGESSRIERSSRHEESFTEKWPSVVPPARDEESSNVVARQSVLLAEVVAPAAQSRPSWKSWVFGLILVLVLGGVIWGFAGR